MNRACCILRFQYFFRTFLFSILWFRTTCVPFAIFLHILFKTQFDNYSVTFSQCLQCNVKMTKFPRNTFLTCGGISMVFHILILQTEALHYKLYHINPVNYTVLLHVFLKQNHLRFAHIPKSLSRIHYYLHNAQTRIPKIYTKIYCTFCKLFQSHRSFCMSSSGIEKLQQLQYTVQNYCCSFINYQHIHCTFSVHVLIYIETIFA